MSIHWAINSSSNVIKRRSVQKIGEKFSRSFSAILPLHKHRRQILWRKIYYVKNPRNCVKIFVYFLKLFEWKFLASTEVLLERFGDGELRKISVEITSVIWADYWGWGNEIWWRRGQSYKMCKRMRRDVSKINIPVKYPCWYESK